MGAPNLLLMDIFRILTPEEISDLTSSYEGDSRVSLTDFIEMKIRGEHLDFTESDLSEEIEGGAKILPFVKQGEDDDVEKIKEYVHAGTRAQELIDRFFIRRSMRDTAVGEDGHLVETSSFIMNEKKRFQYSQEKLKGKEVLSLYQKNAKVDIEQEKMIKDDMSKSTKVGVLVNKRQF